MLLRGKAGENRKPSFVQAFLNVAAARASRNVANKSSMAS